MEELLQLLGNGVGYGVWIVGIVAGTAVVVRSYNTATDRYQLTAQEARELLDEHKETWRQERAQLHVEIAELKAQVKELTAIVYELRVYGAVKEHRKPPPETVVD